jgi:type III restriction enzyme
VRLDGGTGVRNVLTLTDEQIARNMNNVKKRQSLPLTADEAHAYCVEMETGTGKTYVYTKSQ